MEEVHPPGPRSASAARGVALAVAAVIAVGLLARTPATTAPPPTPTPTVAATPPATATPVPGLEDAPGFRTGTWTTVGRAAPLLQLTPAPGVWTGTELVVGFAPDVAAYDPTARAWRSLPAHPDVPLEVRGVVAAGDAVYVYGAKPCPGCAWEGWLHRLDVAAGTWTRLPDAPGVAAQDDADVVLAGGRVVVVRDRGVGAGPQVLAFEPATGAWTDLEAPATELVRWRATAVGERVVVAGSGGDGGPSVLVHDPDTGWRDVGEGSPLVDPGQAAAVATPGGDLVLYGASTRDGGVRGAVLDTAAGSWAVLPPLPGGVVLPGDDLIGPLNGLSGVWDGERALFVGGSPATRFIGWSPAEQAWELRRPPAARAGADAVWTGRQVLLWGGVDRRGPSLELQAWPVRPAD